MSKTIDLKRTKAGGTSATVKPSLAIVIIIDMPVDADDSFELIPANKKGVVLAAKDAKDLAKGAKVLRFVGIKADEQYKLVHRLSKDGATRVVFLESRVQDLTESGRKSPGVKFTYLSFDRSAAKTMGDRYHNDRKVDSDLIATSPALLELEVEDPKL